MPYFSIILPTYNRAKFLNTAIESVINQSFTDWELIIIDDASTDNTHEIVSGYQLSFEPIMKSSVDSSFGEEKIKYLKNNTNIERCKSRNKGIEIATGKYICFLDSDDYHLPNHLEILYNTIIQKQEPKALFFTNAWDQIIGGNLQERNCPQLTSNVFDYIATYTFNPQRMCVHKDICSQIKFDPDVYVCEDLDFAARIALQFPIIQIPYRTTVYVNHPESFTGGDSEKSFKELENYNRIFSKPELRNKFKKQTVKRLKSMCYFHIALWFEKNKKYTKMYNAICKSFLLFPKGYNGKTNKIIFVSFIKNIPGIRYFL